MDNLYKVAADILSDARFPIALTGAGISVESGIPDFRSPGGLWEKYDPAIYASIDMFMKKPEMVWEMIFEMSEIIVSSKSNDAHRALAELEEKNLLKYIITQNIDNLHQEGGSKNVVEYHGNASELQCMECGEKYKILDFNLKDKKPPRCKKCNKILKPAIVFFGEMIPQKALKDAQLYAESADVVIVVGTSAMVYPAASIPVVAKKNGAKIIEFNIENTGLTESGIVDVFIKGSASVTLPKLLQEFE